MRAIISHHHKVVKEKYETLPSNIAVQILIDNKVPMKKKNKNTN